jgi:hypothetical protein
MPIINKEESVKIIKDIMQSKNISRLQLSEMVGRKNPQWIADIFNMNRPEVCLSKNIAMSLHQVFPDLNLQKLLTGEGELFNNTEKQDPAPLPPPAPEKDRYDDFISIIKDLVSQNADNLRIQEKHADAHVKNADANKLHAASINQLITILGNGKKNEDDTDGERSLRDIP